MEEELKKHCCCLCVVAAFIFGVLVGGILYSPPHPTSTVIDIEP